MGTCHIASSKPSRGGRLASTRFDTRERERPAWMDVPLPPRPSGCAQPHGRPHGEGGAIPLQAILPPTAPSPDEDTQQTVAACTLRALTAVRPQEAAEQEAERDRPRVSVEPVHALIIIGVLVIALATSLTLLIQQSMSLAHEQTGTPVASAATGASAAQAPQSTPAASEPARATPDAPAESTVAEPTTTAPTFTPVDLNTASQAQLESVKGIGPVTAANIIAYRASAGRFTSVDELLNVQGIGAKTLEKIRPYVGVR